MAIIGKTGGTGTRSFARANAGYTVPFGATGVTSGTAGVNDFYLLRSHNLNKQIVLSWTPNAWNYVAAVSTTGGAITHPEDNAVGQVKGWIGSTGAFWFQPDAGKTAGAPFGADFQGGQPAFPSVAMGAGVTAIRISRSPYLSSVPYQDNDAFAIFNRNTLIKAYVQNNPVRVFFYTNGTATYNNTDQYWEIPVVHATGSITAGQPGFKPVYFEFPAQIPLDETENDGVRTWAGPQEFQTLYIAHSVPATGGVFDPQQPNNQTQPLRPTIGPGTYGPDNPLGGVGFWGIKSYTEGPDTYIGRDLITKQEAFVQLANNCYIYTHGSFGTFSTPAQVIDWMNDWGFWSNYAGPGCDPDNLP